MKITYIVQGTGIAQFTSCDTCGEEDTLVELRGWAKYVDRQTMTLKDICPVCLTKYAPDVASATSAEPLSGLESVPAVESDTQPRG